MTRRGGAAPAPAPRLPVPVTEAEWREAVRELGPGASNQQLADRLRCHPDSIRRYRRKFGRTAPAELPASPAPPPKRRRPVRPESPRIAPGPVPSWRPASGSGRLVYGYRVASGEPNEHGPASCFVAGMTRSGKSNTFAVLLRQVGGRVYLVDGHAGGPGSLAELLRQPAAVHDQAGAVAAVAEAHAELLRRIEAARAGRALQWEPCTVALDELDRLARPAGPAVTGMLSNLLEIATQGAKFRVFALVGTQNVAGPLSVVPPALRAACGLIVHQVGGRYVWDATGERTDVLPANPARFVTGEALVKLPGRPDFVHVRFPLAPADGEPLSAPPLPAIDARRREREERRELARARGVARDRLQEALDLLRGRAGDEAAAIRGAIQEAVRITRAAGSLAELREDLEPYWPDIDQAHRIAAHADQLARLQWQPAALEAAEEEEPDAWEEEAEEELPAERRRSAPAPGFLPLVAFAVSALTGSRAGMEVAAGLLRPPAPAPVPAPPRVAPAGRRWARAGADLPGRVPGSRYLYR